MNNNIIFQPIIDEKTILIVDDSNITRNLIEKIYKDQYKILMAADGRGAIDIIDVMPEGSIVAVLLDLNMPEVDGFAVLEHFKKNNLFKKVPVAIITGEYDKSVIKKAKSYDVVDILMKPFSASQLEATVTKMVNQKK